MHYGDVIEQIREEKLTRKELLALKKNIKRSETLSERDKMIIQKLIKIKLADKNMSECWDVLKRKHFKFYYTYGEAKEGVVYYDIENKLNKSRCNMFCFNCRKVLKEKWQVKFIDGIGKVTFKECCSEKCCKEVMDYYANIHKKRYEDTKYQSFQNLK